MDKKKNKKNTIDEFGNESGSVAERQEQKKNIRTPDNFGFGDMPADIRKRYLQMLQKERSK